MAFRQSAWGLPLGKIDGLGNTVMTYTDSIPWISIIAKLFNPVLPEIFQFFGWYILICFVLQAVASGMLVRKVTGNELLAYCGVLLFTLSPIMLERAFRHTALASHWLVTFALYLYFASRENGKLSKNFILLAVISIGIHPYFLPMIFGITACSWIENFLKNKKTVLYNSIIFMLSLLITVIAGYLIGALGASTKLGGEGYGYYSMNINAPINPISCGNITWSTFLPVLPQILGNYDGFNYLGLGVIILIVIGLAILIYKKEFLMGIKKNFWIIILGIGLSLFAVSNIVTFNASILIEYPLPEPILKFAAIFRASSRIFYPVYYLLILLGLAGIKYLNYKSCTLIAVMAVMIQIVDIAPGIITKHTSFDHGKIEEQFEENKFNTEGWGEIFDKCSGIKILNGMRDYRLAAFCERNGWKVDMLISNDHFSGGADLNSLYESYNKEITDNSLDKSAYITDDISRVNLLCYENNNFNVYNFDNYFVLVSDAVDITKTKPLEKPEWKTLLAEFAEKELKNGISAADLTDENWERGISLWNDRKVILFNYSDMLLIYLKEHNYIETQGEIFSIEKIESDNSWIHVYVDRDASVCQAPAPLMILKDGKR